MKSIPVAEDLSVMGLELRLPASILIPDNGKWLSLKGTRKEGIRKVEILVLCFSSTETIGGQISTPARGYCVITVRRFIPYT